MLVEPARRGDVGPLQSLIDELEFNEALAKACEDRDEAICPFEITQFSRAISEGIVSLLSDELKNLIYKAYRMVKAANTQVEEAVNFGPGADRWSMVQSSMVWNQAGAAIRKAQPPLKEVLNLLRQQLASD